MKAFKIILALLVVASALSGCMRDSNLKDLTVVEGVAIDDLVADSDRIKITIQSLNIANSTGTELPQGNMTVNTSESGRTIADAINNLSAAVSKELFFGQNKLILFSRNSCENSFADKLDYLLRYDGSRNDINVCMVDGDVNEVISNTENDTHVPIENLVYLISGGEQRGESILVNINDVLNAYLDKTSDMFLPCVKERADRDNSELSGIAIFNGEELSHILNPSDTLGFALITGRLDECFFDFTDNELGRVAVKLTHPRIKKRMRLDDNKLTLCVDIKGTMVITELQNGVIKRADASDLNRLKGLAELRLSQIVTSAFATCQAYDSDALRAGEVLARDYPKLYQSLSNSWKDEYKRLGFSCNTRLKISQLGDNIQME